MCLDISGTTVESLSSMTSEKDIVVYKVLCRTIRSDGKVVLRSPFQMMRYDIGEMIVANKFEHTSKWYGMSGAGSVYVPPVEHGQVELGLHTFATKLDADMFIVDYNSRSLWDDIVVVECIIPAGVSYFKGTFTYINTAASLVSYASEKLFVKAIIN